MITPMNKLDLLLFHDEKSAFLEALRVAGVVHVTEHREKLSEKGRTLQAKILLADKALMVLKKKTPMAQVATAANEGEALLQQFHVLLNNKDECLNEMAECKTDRILLSPWGEIAQDTVDELAEKGVFITLYELSHKKVHLLENHLYETLSQDKSVIRVAVITEQEPASIPGIEPIILPSVSLSEVCEKERLFKARLAEIETEITAFATHLSALASYRQELLDALLLEKAHCAMTSSAEGHLLHLQGWFPAQEKQTVIACLDTFSCWYDIVEPTAEDVVPVLLSNKGGSKLFEPITKIFALPDYFEIDPTPFFAPFYALFFGLCLGDVGYGLLLMILSAILVKAAPKVAGIGFLGLILGFTTTFSGVLLNSFFGASLFATAGQEGFAFLSASHNGFALLKPVVDASTGATIFPAMAFSIYLGLLQIILGMIIKAVNKVRQNGSFIYALYPIGAMVLTLTSALALIKINFLDMASFFTITMGFPLASVQAAMTSDLINIGLIVGLTLLFLFNNPEKKMGIRLPLGLWELYGFVTALMGDALSYIRLFALGLAGGLLGNAFNGIAFMVSADGPSFLMVFTILILVLGHVINFALSVLGSFVHPLRLTFVEFYKNIDFKGGAPAFAPLKSEKK